MRDRSPSHILMTVVFRYAGGLKLELKGNTDTP